MVSADMAQQASRMTVQQWRAQNGEQSPNLLLSLEEGASIGLVFIDKDNSEKTLYSNRGKKPSHV